MLVGGRQSLVGLLAQAGQRSPHAPRLQVGAQGEHVVVAAGPGFEQRGGHQRQRPRLAAPVPAHGVDQAVLDGQTDPTGRFGHRSAQLGVAHGADQQLAAGHQGGQLRVGGAGADVVGPNRQHGGDGKLRISGGADNELGQPPGGLGIAAGGEDLLELIYYQHQAPARFAQCGLGEPAQGVGIAQRVAQRLGGLTKQPGQCGRGAGARVSAGPEHHGGPALAARQRPSGQGW